MNSRTLSKQLHLLLMKAGLPSTLYLDMVGLEKLIYGTLLLLIYEVTRK